MQRLAATERERAIGGLTAKDLKSVVTNNFGVHFSTISRLWHQFQITGTTRDARGGIYTLLRINSFKKMRMNSSVIENERTPRQDDLNQIRCNSVYTQL